ncbi:hypothetical protein AKJ09_08635 [Labilithrix luteola]|uniref:Uncharacterized protein n=1 Tax=Labilithrix luteola TaxID=1391654 RepID=A0A0K1Q8I1_9BACT|nr:hypothetical protein AKJ09_08635 [Labilithrix luteola]
MFSQRIGERRNAPSGPASGRAFPTSTNPGPTPTPLDGRSLTAT